MRLLPCCFLLALLATPSSRAQDMPLSQVLIDGAGWELVAEGYQFTEAPAVDRQGNVYFADVPASRIYRIGTDGQVTLFAENTGRTSGLMFSADGKLYGCQNGAQRIVWYDPEGQAHVVAEEVQCNDLVVASSGTIYVTDPRGRQVWQIHTNGEKRVAAKGFVPNGIVLWPDEGTLVVTDSEFPWLWSFLVLPDGSLTHGERYYHPVRVPFGFNRPGSDGMTVDDDGRLYLASHAGLQVFDPTGRPSGVIAKPQPSALSNVVFGGSQFDTLYVTSTDKVFRRKTQVRGTPYFLRTSRRQE